MKKRPFIFLFTSFSLGVFLGSRFHPGLTALMVMACLLWVAAAGSFFLRRGYGSRVSLALSIAAVMVCGMLLAGREISLLARSDSLDEFLGDEPVGLMGRLACMPERLDDKTVLTLETLRIFSQGKTFDAEGKVRINAYDVPQGLCRGDVLRIMVNLSRPRNFSNPGGFDYVGYLGRRGIAITGGQVRGTAVIRMGKAGKRSWLNAIEAARDKIGKAIRENGGLSEGLIRALIIGERRSVNRDVVSAFQDSGLAHLLSISGLHLGMVAMAGFVIFRYMLGLSSFLALRLNLIKVSAALTMILVLFYAALAGMRIPTIRALIMTWVFLVAVLSGKTYDVWNILFLAAFIILIIWPSAIFEASFSLSFVAVGSLIYVAPRLWMLFPRTSLFSQPIPPDPGTSDIIFRARKFGQRVWRYILNTFIASFVAQAGVSPLLSHYFHQFSPLAPFFNLVILPVCGFFIIPFGIIGAIITLISPAAGGLFFAAIGHAASMVTALVSWYVTLPLAFLLVRPLSWPEILACYALAVAVIEFTVLKVMGRLSWSVERSGLPKSRDSAAEKENPARGDFKKTGRFLVVVAILAVSVLAAFGFGRTIAERKADRLEMTVIDVGHGQSILIEFPDQSAMLLDGGGFYTDTYDVGRFVVAPFLLTKGRKKLDVVALSHPHPDHAKGLRYILSHFKVEEFWITSDRIPMLEELIAIAEKKNITILTVDRNMRPFDMGGVKVSILNPGPEDPVGEVDLNDRSIVFKLDYGKISALLPSDITRSVETELLETFPESNALEADLLVAPHHGSISSSSPGFLDAVNPSDAIFTARESRWLPIPHPKIIERYKKRGIRIWRTDELGAIYASTDGKDLEITSCLELK